MSRKLVVKRLTSSDLKLFYFHHKRNGNNNQIVFKLNSKILVEILYPELEEYALGINKKLPIDLFVFGPGLEGECNLQRKIFKEFQNWRLGEEFIYNPHESPERFNSLQPGDYAILEFIGSGKPSALKMMLISAQNAEDKELHNAINQLNVESMISIKDTDLEQVINSVPKLDSRHPILNLTFSLDADVEDAATGGFEGRKRILSRHSTRQISADTIAKARTKAEQNGRAGEEIINVHFGQLMQQHQIENYEWVSQNLQFSPFDFQIETLNSTKILIEVKSTDGNFNNRIHLSLNELLYMASEDVTYHLYRIYEITSETAKLRIAKNTKSFAQKIVSVLEQLESGIFADNISFSPSLLDFEEEITIEIPEEAIE